MKYKGLQQDPDGPSVELWDITEGPAAGTTVALPQGSTEAQRARKYAATTRLFLDNAK